MIKLILAVALIISSVFLKAQTFKKYDSTMKLGKAGYRIRCNNKNAMKNSINVQPIGFDNNLREVDLDIKGKILKCEVDDFNRDAYPDVLIYVYDTAKKGNVLGIASNNADGLQPIVFPDIADDVKLNEGYNGYDEFQLIQGLLMRKFPIYKKDENSILQLTNAFRHILYKVVIGDKGALKFQIVRTYEATKK